ncbi:hypothetical protein GPL26_16460 [Enterocloster citroniae]|uniref:Uncharacterized protein n=1 Tax=Enterocloster citroniae TaxID=358743 RepID=A0AA41FGN0_9FIRM|nr:hypothetical protein [Enterocloster citroniae]MBT9811219.1 hypothetical protein [Enterocloster citroniae]
MVVDYFKRLLFIFCTVVVVSSAYVFPSFARVATASNADRDMDHDHGTLDDIDIASSSNATFDDEEALRNAESYEYLSDDLVLRYILSEVQIIRDSMSGPAVSSPSEAESLEGSEDVPEDVTILSSGDDISLYASGLSLPDHDVVYVSGTFDGNDYTLLVPASVYPNLWVGEDGVLYNVSSSNITCRLFPGSTFDSSDYNYRNLTLYPLLGNSANNLYRYGYLSYMTYYYRGSSSSSLSSNTTYGNFYVEDIKIQRSLDITYRTYYVAVSSLFALGVIVLCFWKNSRRL